MSSDAERERVIQCLEAAIERRGFEVSSRLRQEYFNSENLLWSCSNTFCLLILQGLELELCTDDRFGLLSDITRVFRENSLSIKRAEISTEGGRAKDIFYVTDVTGNPVNPQIIDSIRQQIGYSALQVKNANILPEAPQETTMSFLFGNIFKCRTLQNFKLIRSYS